MFIDNQEDESYKSQQEIANIESKEHIPVEEKAKQK